MTKLFYAHIVVQLQGSRDEAGNFTATKSAKVYFDLDHDGICSSIPCVMRVTSNVNAIEHATDYRGVFELESPEKYALSKDNAAGYPDDKDIVRAEELALEQICRSMFVEFDPSHIVRYPDPADEFFEEGDSIIILAFGYFDPACIGEMMVCRWNDALIDGEIITDMDISGDGIYENSFYIRLEDSSRWFWASHISDDALKTLPDNMKLALALQGYDCEL